MHDPDLPGLPRMNIGSVIGGRGRNYELRGPYTVSDFCTAYVNVRFNASQNGETVVADIRRTLEQLAAEDPNFRFEIEFPPALERGLGRMAKVAVDVPKTEPVVQMVKRNLHDMTGREPEHFGVRLPAELLRATTPPISGAPASPAASTAPAAATRTTTTCTCTSRTLPLHARPRPDGARSGALGDVKLLIYHSRAEEYGRHVAARCPELDDHRRATTRRRWPAGSRRPR